MKLMSTTEGLADSLDKIVSTPSASTIRRLPCTHLGSIGFNHELYLGSTRATRKKSRDPTTPCASTRVHQRRLGGICATGRLPNNALGLGHSLMREERDEREQAQQCRGGPADRQL